MAGQEIVLVDASVEVNDEPWTIVGNTLTFNEGLGTTSVKSATRGGQQVVVTSQDVTTRVGMIKFDVPASVDSINRTRDVHALGPGAVVRISGTDPGGKRLGRTMTQAVLSNDPEVAIQSEGKLSVEFSGATLTVS